MLVAVVMISVGGGLTVLSISALVLRQAGSSAHEALKRTEIMVLATADDPIDGLTEHYPARMAAQSDFAVMLS